MLFSGHIFNAKKMLKGLFLAGIILAARDSFGANLLNNPDFEEGKKGWSIFIPGESKDKNPHFDIVEAGAQSGKNCAKLEVSDFARFGFSQTIKVTSGQHLKVSAWIRSDASAVAKEKTPGFLIRVLYRVKGKDVGDGMTYLIGPSGLATFQELSKGLNLDKIMAPLPQQWTKVEAVIEIPQVIQGMPSAVDAIELGIFSWYAKGAIYVDNVSIEDVGRETPLTNVNR